MQSIPYRVKSSKNEIKQVERKAEGDDGPTYIKIKDAAKLIGMNVNGLQSSLAGRIYRNEIKNSIYGKIDHALMVAHGSFMFDDPKSKENLYVSLEYAQMRRELRDSAEKRETIPCWMVSKIVADGNLDALEGKYVTEYDLRNRLSQSGIYEKPTSDGFMFPNDPHSTAVLSAESAIQMLLMLPNAKATPGNYVYSLLVFGSVTDAKVVHADTLHAVGLIDEHTLSSVASDARSKVSDRGHVLVRPSDLKNIAGGIDALKRMAYETFPSETYSDKHIARLVSKRDDALDLMRKAFGGADQAFAAASRSKSSREKFASLEESAERQSQQQVEVDPWKVVDESIDDRFQK